jgi:hypothetical protein
MYITERLTPKARKQHTCCECNGAIEPGEVHELITAHKEGAWIRPRSHMVCAILREDVRGVAKGPVPLGEVYQKVSELGLTVEDGVLKKC